MGKKTVRFFAGFIDAQQRWINAMAEKGYRLVNTGKLRYEFEECNPEEYQYYVDFVAQKSYRELKNYKEFLEELGYQVMTKNANFNWSVGKVRVRSYGEGSGKIASSPGNYNKELLIIEKRNDGKPFELHTTREDKILYCKTQRNVYLSILALILLLCMCEIIGSGGITFKSLCMLSLAGIIFIPTIANQKILQGLNKDAKINE